MSASRWTAISAATLSRVMDNQRIGEPPLPLRADPTWMPEDERQRADAAVWAELGHLDWLDHRGRVRGEVLDNLHLLAHPPIEYGAIFDSAGCPRRAVAVGTEDNALLARREGPVVQLAVMDDEFLPESLLRQLPDVAPATTSAVNVRRSDVYAADSFGPDGQTLRRLGCGELVGAGELYVGTRDRYGRHRVSPVIRYQDYAFGRVLVVVTKDYLSVAPASRRLLLDRLREARADVAVW